MSKLTDLIAQVERKDSFLAEELRKEFEAYASRRPFGLNFERHMPESARLYGRPIRKGDKVNVLPERGAKESSENKRVWQVVSLFKETGKQFAQIELVDSDGVESSTVPVDDLVVLAEFSEPIYPGLVETGRVERGGERPYQMVINGENYHALETLLYAYEGKVDCIYIDPPYNTGAKDWKYNNDYVDGEDAYRHSKWLAFMERRLKLAKRLLNPENSVLVVTIDEKEYLRLGLLLEQVFTDARIQMISSIINPAGAVRGKDFARTNEYIYFVQLGKSEPGAMEKDNRGVEGIHWDTFRRTDLSSVRHTRPRQFYPVYVNDESGRIESVGEPLLPHESWQTAVAPDGLTAVFPIRPDGTEMNWGLVGSEFMKRVEKGYVRVGKRNLTEYQQYPISYLRTGRIADVESGKATVVGYAEDGSVICEYTNSRGFRPTTQWDRKSHDAYRQGTNILKTFIGGKRFPFPKSLYAVEDALRLFVQNKPDALIVDFFSGSGTTAHAVMRLNHQDGGQRRSICITNNEVSVNEQAALIAQGFRQGDSEWEALGICEYITKPRVIAAITGQTPEGESIKGDYKFIDEFPMSEGFAENAVFYNLVYQDEVDVSLDRAFKEIAPLLWLRAGSQGRCISERTANFDISEYYAVLFDYRFASGFLKEIVSVDTVKLVYIVTNQDSRFQDVAGQLPESIETVRLYESYLRSYKINQGEV
jgi:adenine-specific DNA-methyltransferase